MTLSQIRNQVHSLQRKYAKELAVFRLRRLAREISEDWAVAIADRQDLPQPHSVVRRVADAGFSLPTFMFLNKYLQRVRDEGGVPQPLEIVLSLLPWAREARYSHLLRWDLPALE